VSISIGWKNFHLVDKNRAIWLYSNLAIPWRGVRVVEGGGLENRCAAMYRGFESHPLRTPLKAFGFCYWRGARVAESGSLLRSCAPKGYRGFESLPLRIRLCRIYDSIAQLDRASDCGSEGRRFESSWDRYSLSRLLLFWRGARVVESAGLEIRYTARYRGFESLPLRNWKIRLER
jgi:hypothetical protein